MCHPTGNICYQPGTDRSSATGNPPPGPTIGTVPASNRASSGIKNSLHSLPVELCNHVFEYVSSNGGNVTNEFLTLAEVSTSFRSMIRNHLKENVLTITEYVSMKKSPLCEHIRKIVYVLSRNASDSGCTEFRVRVIFLQHLAREMRSLSLGGMTSPNVVLSLQQVVHLEEPVRRVRIMQEESLVMAWPHIREKIQDSINSYDQRLCQEVLLALSGHHIGSDGGVKRSELHAPLPALDAPAGTIRSWMQIHKELLRDISELNLCGLDLTAVPVELCLLQRVRRLHIQSNSLIFLPPGWSQSPIDLRSLSLGFQQEVDAPFYDNLHLISAALFLPNPSTFRQLFGYTGTLSSASFTCTGRVSVTREAQMSAIFAADWGLAACRKLTEEVNVALSSLPNHIFVYIISFIADDTDSMRALLRVNKSCMCLMIDADAELGSL
jgi:hypothetical protein